MEKNPYAMAKLGLENDAMQRPQRDCGFYAKYIFLFISLIQFLIILGLVLFMVYSNHRATAEEHYQLMSTWLQDCKVETKALDKEKANLTGLLNASRSESRQTAGQLNRLNTTYRMCSADKLKVQQQLRQAEALMQNCRVCYEMVGYFNTTYLGKVNALQSELKVQGLAAELEKKKMSQENQQLQAQVKKAQQEEVACQRDMLQLRTQVQKTGELENQVMGEMQAASQHVKTAVEAALPSQSIWGCNPEAVRTLQTTCLDLSKQLDGYTAALGRRLEDRVHAVAKENALLQKEKVACSQDRQELGNRLRAQEQHARQERDALQLACSTEKTSIYAQQQKLFGERESLQKELEALQQKCSAVPVPNTAFNPSSSRTGGLPALLSAVGVQGPKRSSPAQQNGAPPGNVGFPRISSLSGYDKVEEGRKPAGVDAIFPHQPLLKPAGQPSG